MEDLIVHSSPELRAPYMITAFMGWPDAGEVASTAMRYLIATLKAERFASLEPEGFYNFTRTRPLVRTLPSSQREVLWQPNEFHYCSASGRDLVLFLGIEPHLRWNSYGNALMEVVRRWGVSRVVTLGGTYDAIPHSVEPVVTVASSDPEFRERLEGSPTYVSNYEGPTSIHSVLLYRCQQMKTPCASLWGHAPHYIQAIPNTKVAYGVLQKVNELLGLEVPLEQLKAAGASMEEQVNQVITGDPNLQSYVRQVEERYRESHQPPTETLNPEQLIKDLENFLKEQGKKEGGSGQSPS